MGFFARLFDFDPTEGARLCGATRSGKWPAVMRAHLKVQPRCAACGCGEGNQVHHIRPFHVVPDSELDPTNLITLCPRCHLFVGHLGTWASWNAEVVADAAVWLRKIHVRPRGEE